MTELGWFVGIDWGAEAHHVCLLDATGQVCGQRVVQHTRDAVDDTLAWIGTRTGAAPHAIAVALETPHGVLVDTLLERGYAVFAINPKQLDRFRDRFTAGGAKDDRRDAHVAADALRTDRRAFRVVRPDDPDVIQLRELCHIVEELQEEELRLTNRLREQLVRVHAPWLTLSPGGDESWVWSLLETAPHPNQWATLPRARITPVLRRHRIRRLSTDDVIAALHRPTLTVAKGVADAVATRIASLLPRLILAHRQRAATERDVERALTKMAEARGEGELREHRDVEILRSLPGVGRTITATMLTEAAGPLADRDYATLRAYSGAAPVTKRSGKRLLLVHMRHACKRRLRDALYYWSGISIQHDVATRAYYDRLRARGHGHARALRSVADRWLRILVAMLKTRTLYDASRFAKTATACA